MPDPDDTALAALHKALAEETDPERFQALLHQLDRYVDSQIRRARLVPDGEHR